MINAQALMPEIDFAYNEVPNLHEILDQLREQGPVVPVTYHKETVWLISGFEELKQAFSDEVHFEGSTAYKIHSEPSMGKTIQTMSGDQHRVNRALVSRPFFPKQVRQAVEELLVPVACELLDRIEGQEQVDLVEAFARPYPFTVITRMLGIPVNDESKLLAWALKLIDYPWDPVGAVQARDDFANYMRPIVNERRANPGGDIISTLSQAEFEGKRLSDEEIFSFLRLLFPAGSDTTFKVGGSLFYAVLSDPTIRAQALQSDAAREAIVQEALRWQPPTALLPRMCSKDTELGGVSISQGDWVLFGITAANSDPSVFHKPRDFNPQREDRNLAFGHGEHFCLGSHLARKELEVALEQILKRFPDMTLAEDKNVGFSGGVLRGTPELWVCPQG
ncbi:MAG: cytochrome P450 [Halieaceae bacterium]|jgi:cytochrome P450|nr:cytochrome P450 [Halieaceae bacterium]